MDETKKCQKCGMTAEGYKCEMCGAEAAEHDPMHACGGEKCVPKCSGCKEAETKCVCPPATPSSPINP